MCLYELLELSDLWNDERIGKDSLQQVQLYSFLAQAVRPYCRNGTPGKHLAKELEAGGLKNES